MGLNALFTRWGRAYEGMTQVEGQELGKFMHDWFPKFSQGYQFREILIEAIGETARDQGIRAGFLERLNYKNYYRRYPPCPASPPFLMGITREEALKAEGCVMPYYFSYRHPRFGFTAQEQKLLALCQRRPEAPNAALAQALKVPATSLPNWWRTIYRRVMDADPGLLPADVGKGRGSEKRRPPLQYLRDHPEELRPYQWSRRRGRRMAS